MELRQVDLCSPHGLGVGGHSPFAFSLSASRAAGLAPWRSRALRRSASRVGLWASRASSNVPHEFFPAACAGTSPNGSSNVPAEKVDEGPSQPPDSSFSPAEESPHLGVTTSAPPLAAPDLSLMENPGEATVEHLRVENQVPGSSIGSPFGGKASGSGLLRSPTTGGVQSATSAHGLPDPAVAARNLVAQSKHAHLCTVMSRMHHRRTGYPFASMVDFANDASGHPIFALSSLAIHARNLLADPRCTLVVQIPGWSGLADARVTIFGEVYPVAQEFQEWASRVFSSRHHQEASEQWGNSHFFRMEVIRDIYFVGGFGTVAWVDAMEYCSVQPDRIASEDADVTLQLLNSEVAGKLRESLGDQVRGGVPGVDSVEFIGVDSKGVDIRVHQGSQSHVRRLSFGVGKPIETVVEAEEALRDMISRGTLPSGLVSQEL